MLAAIEAGAVITVGAVGAVIRVDSEGAGAATGAVVALDAREAVGVPVLAVTANRYRAASPPRFVLGVATVEAGAVVVVED
jgi:hypothetical protein